MVPVLSNHVRGTCGKYFKLLMRNRRLPDDADVIPSKRSHHYLKCDFCFVVHL